MNVPWVIYVLLTEFNILDKINASKIQQFINDLV